MTRQLSSHTTTLACSVLLMSALLGSAYGAFFQISENSAWRLGNAFAGGAAVYEDASTVWYNPAALTQLEDSQSSLAGHFISISSNFNRSAAPATSSFLGGAPIAGGDGGNLGETALVPNAYYTRPVGSRLSIGLGFNAPFGLASDYKRGWVGRYHADNSEILSLNINPAFGWKVSDRLSIGAGVNAQYFDVNITQNIDTGSLGQAMGLAPTRDDSRTELAGDDWSFGYNMGLFWKPRNTARFGIAFRSKIDHVVEGTSRITTSPDATTESVSPGVVAGFRAVAAAAGLLPPDADNIRADVTVPATISVSAYHQINPKWAIMGDITRTRWSKLDELRVEFDSGVADSVLSLGLKNTWRYSVGVTYFHNDRWSYRLGLAFDQTPTPNAELRTPRLPDEDRTWYTLGLHYRKSDKTSIDIGYAYIDAKNAKIRKIARGPGSENFASGSLVGIFRNADINIISVQFNRKFRGN